MFYHQTNHKIIMWIGSKEVVFVVLCNSCIMEAPKRVINVIHVEHLEKSRMVELGKIPFCITSITVKLEIMEPEIVEQRFIE